MRWEVTLLELDVNPQLLLDTLMKQKKKKKKGSSNKTSQAYTCPSIRHPFFPPSLKYTHSFSPSPSPRMPWALVSPGERYVIHYLTFQPPPDGPSLLRLCFPTDPTLVSPPPPQFSPPEVPPLSQGTFLHHNQLIDTADRGEFREPGAFAARFFSLCSVFHS